MTEGPNPAGFRKVRLEAGLYLVATPIGTARDITLRALDILASAEVLVAEDTRVLRHLMELHGIPLEGRRPFAYHDHNGAAQRPRLLGLLREGRTMAYCSDAGTPLVADPGYRLAVDAIGEGARVHCAPGPSAALAALSLSGLPTDRFYFAGFPPAQDKARRDWLEELSKIPATSVIFEAPRRVPGLLALLEERGEGERQVALCRELTKRFEEVRRGTVAELRSDLGDVVLKGEAVLVLGAPKPKVVGQAEIEGMLREKLRTMGVKDASAEVARELGQRKRTIYQLALSLRMEDGGDETDEPT